MFVVMQEGATEEQIESVIDRLVNMGFTIHRSSGVVHTVLGGVGPMENFNPVEFELMDGVKECHRIMSPYKLASRNFRPEGTIVRIGAVEIGGPRVVVMAGPSLVESRDQIETVAEAVARDGAAILRAGVFQARSAPHESLKSVEQGLKLLKSAAERFKLLVVSEVMDHTQLAMMSDYVDIFQVGARNMQNFTLLSALGDLRKPVLLKRGIAATIEEWLMSAEYVMTGGNYDVILCERGIRTFESYTRNTLDISAVPVVKALSHLPVVTDPSQGTGRRDKVTPMALATVAAGGDGLLVEVHNDPENAASDGAQSLRPEQFSELMRQARLIASAVGREI